MSLDASVRKGMIDIRFRKQMDYTDEEVEYYNLMIITYFNQWSSNHNYSRR